MTIRHDSSTEIFRQSQSMGEVRLHVVEYSDTQCFVNFTNKQLDLMKRGRSEIVTDFVRLATCIPDASTTVVVKQ